jgi:hypothetical protein
MKAELSQHILVAKLLFIIAVVVPPQSLARLASLLRPLRRSCAAPFAT